MARVITAAGGRTRNPRSVRCPQCGEPLGRVVNRCETGGVTTMTLQCAKQHLTDVRF